MYWRYNNLLYATSEQEAVNYLYEQFYWFVAPRVIGNKEALSRVTTVICKIRKVADDYKKEYTIREKEIRKALKPLEDEIEELEKELKRVAHEEGAKACE